MGAVGSGWNDPSQQAGPAGPAHQPYNVAGPPAQTGQLATLLFGAVCGALGGAVVLGGWLAGTLRSREERFFDKAKALAEIVPPILTGVTGAIRSIEDVVETVTGQVDRMQEKRLERVERARELELEHELHISKLAERERVERVKAEASVKAAQTLAEGRKHVADRQVQKEMIRAGLSPEEQNDPERIVRTVQLDAAKRPSKKDYEQRVGGDSLGVQ